MGYPNNDFIDNMGKIIWLVVEPTPLKNMKINWDDEISNIWKNAPKHQPVIVGI